MALDGPHEPAREGKHKMSIEALIENLKRMNEAESSLAQAIDEMYNEEEGEAE